MTPSQFYNLDEAEQAETIWEGKYVGSRQDKDHNILLYQIKNLYVEVYYHKEFNVIRRFEAFTKDELLDIYLRKN